MFSVGDRVVHPLHGAGYICQSESRMVDGVEKQFFLLKLVMAEMSILIPADACEQIGVRAVCSPQRAQYLLEHMQAPPDLEKYWNQRYRDNMLRIRSGEPEQVAGVIQSLLLREREKPLSTGERNQLAAAEKILISELMLALDLPYEQVRRQVERCREL